MKRCRWPLLCSLFWITSCGHLNFLLDRSDEKNSDLSKYREYSDDDYIGQLVSLKEAYINSPNIEIIKLSTKGRRFLEKTYKKILANNERFLLPINEPKFYIIKDKVPFHFSLPRAHFFFSVGLIRKYLKSEDLLIAALTYEIIRSQRNLYMKKIIVPVGFINTKRILSLTRIPLEVKSQVNAWSFHIMRRAGHDPFAYLIWLQIQNKNIMDFNLQMGGFRSIFREEFLFKNYIVQEGLGVYENSQYYKNSKRNSSKQFYDLIEDIKKVKL